MLFSKKETKELLFIFCWSAILVLVVSFRCQTLLQFTFKFPDSDQAIMWNAAVEFSKGHFHEPKFFGQNYNSMIEGLFAAPLIIFSVPVYKALPIITSILALFPYLIVSIICIVKKQKSQALLILSIPLFLPIEYDFLTSISRGFVTGIFVASFGWIAVYFQNKRWSFSCFAFFSVVGYSLNPNSFLLTIPLFLYLFFENFKNRSFYFGSSIGLVGGEIINYLANHFYVIHPNYSSRLVPTLSFSFQNLSSSFQNLDKHLNFLSPFFWNSGWFIFILLVSFSLCFWAKKQMSLFFSILAFVFCILASFGLDKIQDGTNSVFFSYSRMFLAIPVGFCFFIPFINFKYRWLTGVILSLSFFFFFLKLYFLNNSVEKNIYDKKIHVVSVDRIENILKECQTINYYSKKHNTDLIIIYNHGYFDFIDFGCSTCLGTFPITLRPEYERRTWRLIEDEKTVYKNIIIIDEHQDIADRLKRLKSKSIYYLNINGYYILSNNTLGTMELLDYLDIPVRNF